VCLAAEGVRVWEGERNIGHARGGDEVHVTSKKGRELLWEQEGKPRERKKKIILQACIEPRPLKGEKRGFAGGKTGGRR